MLWRLFQTGVVGAKPDCEETNARDVFLFVLFCEYLSRLGYSSISPTFEDVGR